MHNALITELQRAGVPVIARTSVLQYRNTQKPIREIATELGVDAGVESSVMRTGDSVEMEVSLVDGTTEQYIADPIVRRSDMRNVVGLYRQITGAIAAEIQTALTPESEARLASSRTVNPEAYEAYLRGQFHWYKLTPVDLQTALEYYDVALQHDPSYAPAYAGISLAWAGLQQMALVPAGEAGPRSRAAALRALELDSTLVEVQYALALVKTWTDWDWPAGEAAFLKAIEIKPNYPDVRAYYSHFLCSMKRPEEAMEQMERATALDPFHPLIMGLRGAALAMVGRYDEAVEQFQTLLQTVPNHPVALNGLMSVYYVKGMYEESVEAAEAYYNVIEFAEAEEALSSGYAEGSFEEAMRRAAEVYVALSLQTWVASIEIASLYMYAGQIDEAVEWFERAYEEHDPNMPYWNVWPGSESLSENPRFQALLRRVGMPL